MQVEGEVTMPLSQYEELKEKKVFNASEDFMKSVDAFTIELAKILGDSRMMGWTRGT